MQEKEYLRIGELASRLGLNPKTIRYYEDLGIVNPVRESNGYRLFSAENADQLRFVLRAKNFGLTLIEIKELLEYARLNRCETVKGSLRKLVMEKITMIEGRIQELIDLKKNLESFLKTEEGVLANPPTPDGDCSCI